MGQLSDLWFRLRAIITRRTRDRELDDELAFHLEMEAQKHLAKGGTPEQAKQRAAKNFGHLEGHRRQARETWGVSMFEDLMADVRFAARQLARKPAFAILAVLTLGLGIGGTVALWSVVQGVLLKPLPFADEEKLAVFWAPGDWFGVETDFARQLIRGFDHLTAFSEDTTTLRRDDNTSMLSYVAASGDLFQLLGTPPLHGRTFGPQDDEPGAEPVIVLSHGMWQRELGGDPQALGRQLLIGGRPTTVIGVMPPEFYFPYPEHRAWMPLRLDPSSEDYHQNGYLQLIARVHDGWTTAQVEASIASLTLALGERFDYPEAWDKSKGAYVTPLRSQLLGPMRPALWMLLGAVGLLMIMACANVAALLLARSADRGAELGVRAALGAGRGRLARQLLTESTLLALLAAGLGTLLATGLFEVLVASLPLGHGFDLPLSFDWTSLESALALALATATVISILPIRGLSKHRFGGHLAEARRQASPDRRGSRLQKALVLGEALLAVTLVIGATLLVRSVTHLQNVEPGLEAEGVLVVDLVAGPEEMDTQQRRSFFAQVVQRSAALPGVRSATLTNRLALRDDGSQGPVEIEDRPDLESAERPSSYLRTASPDYFRALGIDIVKGRAFDAKDRADGQHVAIVSASFAQRVWPGQNAVGKQVRTRVEDDGELATVVGVAEEVRMTSLVGDNPLVLYRPEAQRRWPGVGNTLLLATDLDAATLAPEVRQLVRQLDPRVAVAGISTMQEVVDAKMSEPVRLRFLLGLFAVLGLILGTVGVYGVVSYGVTRRRTELGVRMALGASPREVWLQVVGQGLLPVALGTLCGMILSLGLWRLLRGLLFHIKPSDPMSFLLAAGILLTAGVLAALIPAWQASRVDPSVALRSD